jgi:hypothetical protein
VSVGWWCGRLLLYFTLSLISLSLLVLSTSNNLAARRRRRRRRRRVLSLISSSSLLTFGRIVSFFHPSLDSPDTFQVSFSLQFISSPCHSYRRRMFPSLTIELPIVLLRVPVCIWFDVGTRDGRHCRWEMAGQCRRCKCQLLSIIERRAFVVCSSPNDSQSLLEKTEKKTKRKETK